MPRPIVTTGVPIDCVNAVAVDSAPFGTELSPAALRAAGLPAAVGAADAGDLPVRLVGRDRDPATGVLGWPSVLATTQAVRDLVRDQVAAGQLPFLLGGCCTLLPGALSGARDALGAIGLGYLDGHLDLYDGQTSETGEPADMPISVITGHGPAAWSAAIGAPLVTRPGLVAAWAPGPRLRQSTMAALCRKRPGWMRSSPRPCCGTAGWPRPGRRPGTSSARPPGGTGCISTWTCWTSWPSRPPTT